ncbi:DsbA family protein [Amycolatopsis sp. cg5]|uniref:DsbA family protein n=1 Tax=Amycolatopsis sp. cg5 TaxID=3238802 RepID=UPI0035251B88
MTQPKPPIARSRKAKPAVKALVVLVIAVVLGGGLYLQLRNNRAEADGYGPPRTAARISAPGVVTLGAANAPHTVDVYEDPLCPFCAQFEKRFGQLLAKAIDEGKAKVNYHLLTFLDAKSKTGDYSTRAAAAMLCATKVTGTSFGRLHEHLMAPDNQPSENGSTDRTNDELIRFAFDAGAGPDFGKCLLDGTFQAELRDTTAAVRPTIPGTPSVRIDGRLVAPGDLTDGDWAEPLR